MRTTIELADEQHEAISALARKRGDRGLSHIVQLAVDLYLGSLRTEEVNALLALEGSWSDEEADATLEVMRETRGTWRSVP